MNKPNTALVSGLLAFILMTAPAMAGGTIEKACLKSERNAANRSLCSCLQVVADDVLTRADQRRGARFFTDPHMSQEVRASSSRADDAFWERWTRFAKTSASYCGD